MKHVELNNTVAYETNLKNSFRGKKKVFSMTFYCIYYHPIQSYVSYIIRQSCILDVNSKGCRLTVSI